MPGGSAADPVLREAARQRASSVKWNRRAIKYRVKVGEITVPDVVIANPPDCRNMTLFELLCAQTRWQRARALKFLGRVEVSEVRTISELTDRQRLVVEAEWHRQERETARHRRVNDARSRDRHTGAVAS